MTPINVLITITFGWIFVLYPLWSLIDCLKTKEIGLAGKIFWALVISCLPIIGATAYGFLKSKSTCFKWLASITICIVFILTFRFFSFARKISVGSYVKNLEQLSARKTETIPESLSDANNAASVYLRAQKILIFPDSKEERERIKEYSKSGWVGTNTEMIRLLNGNKACLEEVEKALGISKCDFYFGIRQKTKMQQIPKYAFLKDIKTLYLIQGRRAESEKKTKEAIANFLIPLRMSLQVLQNEDRIAPMISLIMASDTMKSIKDFLNKNPNLTWADLGQLSTGLRDFQRGFFPPEQYMEIAKNDFLSIVNLLADAPQDFQWADGKEPPTMTLLRSKLKERGNMIATEFFIPYTQAAISNSESDWLAIQNQMEQIKVQLGPKESIKWWIGEVYAALKSDTEVYTQNYVDRIIRMLLSVGVPNMKKEFEKYHEMKKDLDDVIGEVSTRVKVQEQLAPARPSESKAQSKKTQPKHKANSKQKSRKSSSR